MLILCTSDVVCAPHQQMATQYRDSTGGEVTVFPSQAACMERVNLIREQANVFVLSAGCYSTIKAPTVRFK